MIKKAKIRKDLNMLEEVHNTVLESLQYLIYYKKTHRRDEIYHLNDEITQLETLNALIFKVFAEIIRNQDFRLKSKNKTQKYRRD